MKDSLRLGFTLFVVCALSAIILAISNNATKGVIFEREFEESVKLVKEMFGEEYDYEILDETKLQGIKESVDGVLEIYIVKNEDEIIGYGFKTVSNGYKPDVIMLVGVNIDKTVKGVKVISHEETNGIGTNALTDEYLNTFNEISLENEVPSDVVSGATRTSAAVIKSVNIAKDALSKIGN